MADKHHITETPDTSYIKNIDVTHEISDVQVPAIAKFVVALALLMVFSFLMVWGVFRMFDAQTVEQPRSPMALSEKDRLPPEPRLQSAPGFAEDLEKSAQTGEKKAEATPPLAKQPPRDPLFEIRVLRAQWDDVLKHGPVDQNGQRYGMPIEQAKEEALKELAKK